MTALGQSLCRDALGNNFGKQFWGIALGSSSNQFSGIILPNNYFEEQQLWKPIFGDYFTNNFGKQLSILILGRNFREPLCRMACGSRFGEQVQRILESRSFGIKAWGNNFGILEQFWSFAGFFGMRLSVATLKNYCREQFCGFAPELTNSCFKE